MPFLVQCTEGMGTPEAVQETTTGDSFVTSSSVASSAMDGGTGNEEQGKGYLPTPICYEFLEIPETCGSVSKRNEINSHLNIGTPQRSFGCHSNVIAISPLP